jgi:hypothetical protein
MRLKKTPEFLVVQFAPGSAGKFVMSVLMRSPRVAHFDATVEADKTDYRCLQYIKHAFRGDFDRWILHEPQHAMAWNLHFISAKYPRGDDLTVQQFFDQADQDATQHFVDSVNAGQLIPIARHKTTQTEFFASSKFVTIRLDANSLRWYHRAYWSKLFGLRQGKIYLKENDPALNVAMQSYIASYQNPIYVEQSPFAFLRHNVINNKYKTVFANVNSAALGNNNITLDLSTVLSESSFVTAVSMLAHTLDLGEIPKSFVRLAHQHWKSCHGFKHS